MPGSHTLTNRRLKQIFYDGRVITVYLKYVYVNHMIHGSQFTDWHTYTTYKLLTERPVVRLLWPWIVGKYIRKNTNIIVV